jgi:hypothetical protein
LLGAYTKAEDEAMNTAFGARGNKRLNRVFDVIGFVYPDYYFLARKQGVKRKKSIGDLFYHAEAKENKSCNSPAEVVFFRKGCYAAYCRGFKDRGC